MISPYLVRPLRTQEEVQRALREAATAALALSLAEDAAGPVRATSSEPPLDPKKTAAETPAR